MVKIRVKTSIEKVGENLQDYDGIFHGGPLHCMIMLKLLTTLTDEACATLIKRLPKLTLQDDLFPGEDVDKVVSIRKGKINGGGLVEGLEDISPMAPVLR